MPITSSSVFDRVVRSQFSWWEIRQGDTRVANVPSTRRGIDPTDPEVAEIIRRVKNGTCAVYHEFSLSTSSALAGTPPTVYLDADLPRLLEHFRHHVFHATEGWRYPQAFIREGEVEVDAATGRVGLATTGGIVNRARTPTTPEFDQSLGVWVVNKNSPSQFRFLLAMSQAEGWTAANINEHPATEAMRGWLEALRSAGSAAVGADVAADASFTNRTYEVTQSPGSILTFQSVPEFPVTSFFRADGTYSELSLYFRRLTSAVPEPDPAALDAVLDAATVAVATRPGIEKPPFGGYETPTQGGSFDFDGEGRKFGLLDDQPYYEGKDIETGRKYKNPLGSGFGRSMNHADLPQNNSGQHLFPVGRNIETIHFRGTANSSMRLLAPPNHLPTNDIHQRFYVHNRSPNGSTYTILDWDGDELFTLTRREFIQLQEALDEDGGGEVIGIDPPDRIHLHTGGNVGVLGTDFWNFMSTHWMRPFPIPSADPDFSHADTYRAGTASINAGVSWVPVNILAVPQSIVTLKEGPIDFYQSCEVEVQGGGTLPEGHEARLYRVRPNAVIDLVKAVPYDELGGEGSTRSYELSLHDRAEVGDVYLALFWYPHGTSMSVANINVSNFRRAITIKPRVLTTYAA